MLPHSSPDRTSPFPPVHRMGRQRAKPPLPSRFAALHEEYKTAGATIRHAPENYPWAYEMKVEDPDGHVLRFGSEPRTDMPFAQSD